MKNTIGLWKLAGDENTTDKPGETGVRHRHKCLVLSMLGEPHNEKNEWVSCRPTNPLLTHVHREQRTSHVTKFPWPKTIPRFKENIKMSRYPISVPTFKIYIYNHPFIFSFLLYLRLRRPSHFWRRLSTDTYIHGQARPSLPPANTILQATERERENVSI